MKLDKELQSLGVSSIDLHITINFADRRPSLLGGSLADFMAILHPQQDETPEADTAESDQHTYFVYDTNFEQYWLAPEKGSTPDLSKAHAYKLSDIPAWFDPEMNRRVRTDMPPLVRDILINNVEDFKNGYKAARDQFEASGVDLDAITYSDKEEGDVEYDRIRKNSRMLRETWKQYYNFG